MSNIERAIERLWETTSRRSGPGYAHYPTVDINDCRAEIVALMRWIVEDRERCGTCDARISSHEDWCPLAALAAKILGEQG